jgi:hypothetical protein
MLFVALFDHVILFFQTEPGFILLHPFSLGQDNLTGLLRWVGLCARVILGNKSLHTIPYGIQEKK